MENNVRNNILNILQQILDKIELLTKNKEPKSDLELRDKIVGLYKIFIKTNNNNFGEVIKQHSENSDRIKEIKKLAEDNNKAIYKKNIKTINNTTNEVFLFGKESKVSLRFIGLMLVLITLITSSLKFLPLYFSDYNIIKKEKEKYKLIYNYLYLSEFHKKNNNVKTLEKLKSNVENNDKDFFNTYNSLKSKYEKVIRKEKLQQELKLLQ